MTVTETQLGNFKFFKLGLYLKLMTNRAEPLTTALRCRSFSRSTGAISRTTGKGYTWEEEWLKRFHMIFQHFQVYFIVILPFHPPKIININAYFCFDFRDHRTKLEGIS